MPRVAAIVLAAGGSTRMGRPKQLLTIDGKALLVRTAAVAIEANCDPVVVVVGRDADACSKALAGLRCEIVRNENWQAGMGGSLRAGANALPADTDSAFVLLCDQPGVTASTLTRLLDARRRSNASAVVAAYADTIGPPVLVGRDLLKRLRHWPDAAGAKALWTATPGVERVACPEAADDIDTPADYERAAGPIMP